MVLEFIKKYVDLSSYNFMKRNDDDFVDKMSRKFSTIMMIIFSIVVTTAELVGKPIKCWCPNEFGGGDCAYATTYCYITSQYVPVSNGTNLPSKDVLMSHKILYYQWIPYVFLFQAFLFHLPYLIWKWLNKLSEFSVSSYIDEIKNDKEEMINNKITKYVSTHMHICFGFGKSYIHRGTIKRFLSNTRLYKNFSKSYLYFSYIFVKILYLSIALSQIYLLNYWLSNGHYTNKTSGFFEILFGNHNWELSERFPRMTLCQFQVYIIRFDEQQHWLQCTLPINIYIEKIYIIIWIWLWLLVTFILIKTVLYVTLLLPYMRLRFLREALKSVDNKSIDFNKLDSQLGLDGLLVIKLIKANTSKLYSSQILYELSGFNDQK